MKSSPTPIDETANAAGLQWQHRVPASRIACLRLMLAGVMATVFCDAQSPENAKAAKVEPTLVAFRSAMADAKSAAINRLPESAEQRLSGLNRSRAGTAEWHLEIAQRLIHLATDLATEAKTASVRPIAERALHNTVLAERLAQKPDLRAAAKTMTGFIQDRFLGDRRAALLSYREAAQLSPKAHQAQHQEANLGLWLAREEQKGGPRP